MSNWISSATAVPGHPGPEEDEEPYDAPPEGSGYYRPAKDARTCEGCMHALAGVCHLWNAKVDTDAVCDEWMADADFIESGQDTAATAYMSEGGYAHIFFSEGTVLGEDRDGLIWKEALRTGQLVMSPGPGQKPVSKPLVVRLRATNPSSELGLEDLAEAFNDKAMDHVTIPLSHADRVEDNTGFVEKVKIVKDKKRPGEYVLLTGNRFTEPEIREKVKRGSIANTSVGVLFGYVRKRDGKKYGQAMGHLALTNKPWVDGLTPFGVNASEVMHFSEIALGSGGPLPGGTPEKDNWVDAVGGLPRYVREVARELMKKGWTKSRSIATAISRIKVWAATSKDPKTKAKAVAAIAQWEAKKAKARVKSVKMSDQEFVDLILSEANGRQLSEGSTERSLPAPISQMALDEARTYRRESMNARGEVKMSEAIAEEVKVETPEGDGRLEALTTELSELRTEVRTRRIDDKIAAWQSKGYSPKLLTTVKDVLLAADDGPVLQLSEDGQSSTLSLSEVVDRFMDALPEPEVKLADQHRKEEDGGRPQDKDDTPSAKDRALAAAKELGDDTYLKSIKD